MKKLEEENAMGETLERISTRKREDPMTTREKTL